ncbi:hypothetical protein AX17_000141 [Amanita inopinata Kibby_2008]|nr:hypothetical protein AX17_000141 [Amanita inopinata Kibby_2008]
MLCDYERRRQLNIQKNTETLKALELDKSIFELEGKPIKARGINKKRKDLSEEIEDSRPASKTRRVTESCTNADGIRRSARNLGKHMDYKSETPRGMLASSVGNVPKSGNEGPLGRDGGQRTHNPKTFGHIPDIEVGIWWESRKGCSADSVHAPWVAGIAGGKEGAYSVAISGGYDDDVDLGYAFTYTGSGGRALKGTKSAPKNVRYFIFTAEYHYRLPKLRTAPQSSDQSFENPFNKTLLKSVETKKPVRVIRGFKLKSKYAPSEGYRYDGLYAVEKAWMEKGLNPGGYLVCKFAFKRLPGQPPIPEKETAETQEHSEGD